MICKYLFIFSTGFCLVGLRNAANAANAANAQPAADSHPVLENTLSPVIVEGDAVFQGSLWFETREFNSDFIDQENAESHNPYFRSHLVQVPVGQGAMTVDAPVNELGIEIKNMEHLPDISQQRRLAPWWLAAPERVMDMDMDMDMDSSALAGNLKRSYRGLGQPGQWRHLIHGDFSLDQKIRGRTDGRLLDAKVAFEAGILRDHREMVVRQNSINPFDGSSGRRRQLPVRRDQSFARIRMEKRTFQMVVDLDDSREDLYAGGLLTGMNTTAQQGFSGRWIFRRLEILPFFQSRQSDFTSKRDSLYSNSAASYRGGALAKLKGLNESDLIESSFVHETIGREYADQSHTWFSRNEVNLVGAQSYSYSLGVLKMHGGVLLAQDQVGTTKSPRIDSSSRILSEPTAPRAGDGTSRRFTQSIVWDVGTEVSSPTRYVVGAVARIRRFTLIPTPGQRFGDGALLRASPTLEPESGLRASVGPWWRGASTEVELAAFYERIFNSPVVVGVSPSAARTLAIGGVWVQGWQAKAVAYLGSWSFWAFYNYQEALNASRINWQKGKAVPGRPMHVAKIEINYMRPRGWRAGGLYGYKSAEALDLAGLWFKVPHHDLETFVGYGAKSWEVRITGANLLSQANGLPAAEFAGRASADLLQPTIEQAEIRLQCEFSI